MNEEIVYIYIHKNKINGKMYIGQSKNPSKRWGKNGLGYKPHKNGESRFWNAIQKYGWNNFDHIIIAKCLYREMANQLEKELIFRYNTTNDKYGYNIAIGGDGNSGFQNWTKERQEEYRRLQSKLSKEKWKNEEYIKKQKAGMKKVMATEEYSQKMSKSVRKYWSNKDNIEKHKKITRNIKGQPIRCVETGMVFSSISEANECFGKSTRSTAIHDFFRGKSKSALGYHWEKISKEEYYVEIENNSNE